MSSILKSENQELLRQLKVGQNEIQASLNRVIGVEPRQRRESVKCLQDKKNVAIRTDTAVARSKLVAKALANDGKVVQSPAPVDKFPKHFLNEKRTSLEPPESAKRMGSVRFERAAGGMSSGSADDSTQRLDPGKISEGVDVEERTNVLMEDSGNLRRQKRSIEQVEPEDIQGVRSILSRSGVQRRTTPSRVHFDGGDAAIVRSKSAPAASEEEGPAGSSLLGYDWIAGMLENCGKMEALDQSTDYFDDLRKFRRQNKDECIAREFRHESLIEDVVHDLRPGQRVDIQPRSGRLTVEQVIDAQDCEEPVYSYTVNERLFPTPLNAETENREGGTPESPQIIKISVPSYRLQKRPSRLQPHRRRSVDEADSFSLVSHCQVGFHPGPLTKSKPAPPADLPSVTDAENTRRRKPPRSEQEALASIRRSIKTPRRAPVDIRPSPSPRVIEALLTRKDMNVDSTVTARCEAVRRAGNARPIR